MSVYATCMWTKFGKYTIHEAAKQGNLRLIKHLNGQGLALNHFDNFGNTPLVVAAVHDHFKVVKYLSKQLKRSLERFENQVSKNVKK